MEDAAMAMQWESKEEEHAREAGEAWQAYLRQQRSRSGWAQYLRCRPMSLLGKNDGSNFVVMPASALERLTSLGVGAGSPMEFRVQNAATLDASHLGVLEFGCEEGFVHVPAHAMARLGLRQDDLVLVTRIAAPLPKAASITLRPHAAGFLRAKDHKELLEHCMKSYSMVTVGDTIAVYEGDTRYLLDVVDAKPAHAVSTLDTDCEVDFALPLDYVQPPPVAAPVKVPTAATCQGCADGKERRFVGVGIRMDGKPVEQTPPPATAPAAGSSGKLKGNNNATSEHVLRFFGGRVGSVPPAGAKSAKKKVDGEEDKEAKRFAGQKYTL
ncbi:Ubiquitin fusion degradation 1-like protein [Hordeum vulgare]|nr:Ubiquitin fusion degradation 1-like protein [Hordeum vulgare]